MQAAAESFYYDVRKVARTPDLKVVACVYYPGMRDGTLCLPAARYFPPEPAHRHWAVVCFYGGLGERRLRGYLEAHRLDASERVAEGAQIGSGPGHVAWTDMVLVNARLLQAKPHLIAMREKRRSLSSGAAAWGGGQEERPATPVVPPSPRPTATHAAAADEAEEEALPAGLQALLRRMAESGLQNTLRGSQTLRASLTGSRRDSLGVPRVEDASGDLSSAASEGDEEAGTRSARSRGRRRRRRRSSAKRQSGRKDGDDKERRPPSRRDSTVMIRDLAGKFLEDNPEAAAGAGVDHEQLCALLEERFHHYKRRYVYRKRWAPDDKLDVKDRDGAWYVATVREVDAQGGSLFVHYDGYDESFDEWVPVEPERVARLHKHTVSPEVKNAKLREAAAAHLSIFTRLNGRAGAPGQWDSAAQEELLLGSNAAGAELDGRSPHARQLSVQAMEAIEEAGQQLSPRGLDLGAKDALLGELRNRTRHVRRYSAGDRMRAGQRGLVAVPDNEQRHHRAERSKDMAMDELREKTAPLLIMLTPETEGAGERKEATGPASDEAPQRPEMRRHRRALSAARAEVAAAAAPEEQPAARNPPTEEELKERVDKEARDRASVLVLELVRKHATERAELDREAGDARRRLEEEAAARAEAERRHEALEAKLRARDEEMERLRRQAAAAADVGAKEADAERARDKYERAARELEEAAARERAAASPEEAARLAAEVRLLRSRLADLSDEHQRRVADLLAEREEMARKLCKTGGARNSQQRELARLRTALARAKRENAEFKRQSGHGAWASYNGTGEEPPMSARTARLVRATPRKKASPYASPPSTARRSSVKRVASPNRRGSRTGEAQGGESLPTFMRPRRQSLVGAAPPPSASPRASLTGTLPPVSPRRQSKRRSNPWK